MFLTAKQANERLGSGKNLALRFAKEGTLVTPEKQVEKQALEPTYTITEKVITLPGKNKPNLSQEARTDIAIRTRLGESQAEIARATGLNTLTVNNIAQGKVKGIDEEKVERVIGEARDLALERLMSSLGLLTEDKLSGCSAKDLSVIASNMGRVVEKIQTKETQPDNINFIIYSPELKQERAFEIVEI
jgi:transcriptional regulator with XRE-family HTH domain